MFGKMIIYYKSFFQPYINGSIDVWIKWNYK